MGRSKIEGLVSEWYGFMTFTTLVNVVLAIFGSGIFSILTVPIVLAISAVGFAITWGIGRLLLGRSSVTRIVLIVLAPIAFLGDLGAGYELIVGPWSIGMLATLLLVAAGAWMQLHSLAVLLDADVRRYFA
jgi:hypothetical protein